MRKTFGLLLFLISSCCYGQRSKIDSLQKLLASAEKDTTRIRRCISLGYAYYGPDIDSALVFGNKALKLSQKIHWAEGEAKSQALLCKVYGQKGNTPKSLSLALSSLKTFENMQDTINMIDCFINLSLIYGEEDFERSVQYAEKGYSLAKLINSPRWIMHTSSTLGEGYANLAIADSALVYYQEAYKYCNSIERGKESNLAYIFRGLGRVQYLLNNKDLALSYLYKSLSYARSHKDYNLLANICQIFSDVYKDFGKTDSSLVYSKSALASSLKTSPQDVLGAYKQLAKLYKGINNDSSVKYFELQNNLRDSLFNAKKKTDLANLTSNEEDRQRELVVTKQNDEEERKRDLQYAAIAIGLIGFIILFVAFSRSVIVKTKFIEFFGVLGLLAVFEFINLFIHPYLAHATNDSPVLMLGILIAIGALLIPLHHKLEKWITQIMVEKNKKIRLAAAKKTIQQLEG